MKDFVWLFRNYWIATRAKEQDETGQVLFLNGRNYLRVVTVAAMKAFELQTHQPIDMFASITFCASVRSVPVSSI